MDEEWRKAIGYENYSVSNLGRVRREVAGRGTHAGRPLKARVSEHGYEKVGLFRLGKVKYFFVHRLVAAAFVSGRSEIRGQINHIDGDKRNNTSANLEWCSSAENFRHAKSTGLTPAGEKHGHARLTDDSVVSIRNRHADGERTDDLAAEFGVHPATIRSAVAFKTWRHVA